MDTRPPQTRWSADTNRHIPAGITEEILLNLPVKSLLRFSSASKSWNSIIHEASFSKKYGSGKERIILLPSKDEFLSCSLSAVLSNSNNPTLIEGATRNHVCPIYNPSKGKISLPALPIIDVCHGFWFVENRNDFTMFVWNPTTGEYRKLQGPIGGFSCLYGLGYDSAADDYKLLNYDSEAVTLYSLRSNSWRKINFPLDIRGFGISNPSCCVHGKLHWLYQKERGSYDYVIVSFDLSTEEYGEFSLPPEYSPPTYEIGNELTCTISSLRGNLCLSLNYLKETRFVVWVMEEYGVVESWTKKLDFDYSRISFENECYRLRPLYMCNYGHIVIYLTPIYGGPNVVMLVKKDGKTLLRKNFGKEVFVHGFVYAESVASPAMYVGQPAL